MQKISSWREFEKGGIYNRIYTGSNGAYGRINGKETFRVIETSPILKTETLFDQFGSFYSEELIKAPTTYHSPEIAFREYDLFKPESKEEWFIKSIKVTSLDAALEAGVPLEKVQDQQFRTNRYVSHRGNGAHLGYSIRFDVDGVPTNPYLQTVFAFWKTFEEMREDFAQYGTTFGG